METINLDPVAINMDCVNEDLNNLDPSWCLYEVEDMAYRLENTIYIHLRNCRHTICTSKIQIDQYDIYLYDIHIYIYICCIHANSNLDMGLYGTVTSYKAM